MEPDPNEPLPRAVAIVGPTAAGKSRIALELAEAHGVGIIGCDSVQVYRGLDIGTAKPSADDRRRVPHSGIDCVDPDVEFSAGQYGELVRRTLAAGPAIICGGTGFYLRAAGWSHSGDPRKDDHGSGRRDHDALWMEREATEPGAVHRALQAVDPATSVGIHPRNVVRALRALWLCEREGEPISELRKREPPRTLIDLLVVVIDPGVDSVDRAIADRCDAMLAGGWIAEVENLRTAGYDSRHKSMRSLGYREINECLELSKRPGVELRDAIVLATRHYARRQRTYFRHQFPDLPVGRRMGTDPSASRALDIARIARFLRGES